ncbi:MAG: hypothetical protein OJF50_000202 [Nitrospira sp.]|nr:hypothetical protein [Nitrospira sp.]
MKIEDRWTLYSQWKTEAGPGGGRGTLSLVRTVPFRPAGLERQGGTFATDLWKEYPGRQRVTGATE